MRTILILCLLAGGPFAPAPALAQTDTSQIVEAGNAELRAGRYAEAERLYRQALAVYQALDPNSQNTGVALNNFGLALENQRKFAEAEKAYLAAQPIRARVLGADRLCVARACGQPYGAVPLRGVGAAHPPRAGGV